MFDLEPGEDLGLVLATARSFAQEQLAPRIREAEAARDLDPAVRGAFGQIGLAGLELPEALGGAGLGPVARALVNEELAAADAGAALALDPLGPALYALAEVGGEAALAELAVPLLERDGARALLVWADDASLSISGDTVSGHVPWVPADRVDLLVVMDADGCWAVREDIGCEPLRGAGLRAAGAAELQLSGAPLAGRWSDASGARRALARARLYVASLLLGVMRQACEFSRGYALEREAFGRPIAHHQGLAFLITDMNSAVDGARLLLHEAAWQLESEIACHDVVASAFVEAVEASAFVGPNGVQILGGHGFMQDYPVEKHMREARALGLMFGGIDAARDEAGRALCEGGPRVALSHVEAG